MFGGCHKGSDPAQRSVDSSIDPKLTELSRENGPLHLINTTLNTTKFPEKFRKGRHAELQGEKSVFPQESTGDQFFDETQFECYRALGYRIADRA